MTTNKDQIAQLAHRYEEARRDYDMLRTNGVEGLEIGTAAEGELDTNRLDLPPEFREQVYDSTMRQMELRLQDLYGDMRKELDRRMADQPATLTTPPQPHPTAKF